MSERPTYMITTAIPYANGAPHIGHAYERIATDAFARWKRLDGYDVLFVTGMDEHGQKMMQTAAAEGLTPQGLADRTAGQFEAMGDMLNARADDVVRTTQQRHKDAVLEIWRRMEANGDLYLSKYAGWYSVRDEAYFDESELTEQGGRKYAPTGAPVEWVEEDSWFFRLSNYADRLLAHYEAQPDFITPQHYKNEIVAFVKRGLTDLSVSRTTFDWGIPVPPSPQTNANHVMYVWVDALTNYITATGWLTGQGPRTRFWPADAHVIGKDITRFHAIYWPAFLMSAGAPLPKQIVVHGHLLMNGEKMSKSLGNVVSADELVARFGVDQTRYWFLREVSFGYDGNYTHKGAIARINSDLANDLGNLAQRSLSMIAKNCSASVPRKLLLTESDKDILAQAAAVLDKTRAAMDIYAPHNALVEIFRVVAEANRYFAGEEPWAKKKTDPARMETVLYVTAETIRRLVIPLQPFMPESAGKLLDLLGVGPDERDFAHAGEAYALQEGAPLPPPAPVFPRYVEPEEPAG